MGRVWVWGSGGLRVKGFRVMCPTCLTKKCRAQPEKAAAALDFGTETSASLPGLVRQQDIESKHTKEGRRTLSH